LNISALNIYNDSVGNEWEQIYTVHGVKISDGQTFLCKLDKTETIKIKATIKEIDKHSDIASKYVTINLKDKETQSTEIIVTENNGKYKDNISKWIITFSVKLIDKKISEL